MDDATAVVPVEVYAPAPAPTPDSLRILADVVRLADVIAATSMVPDALRGDPGAVVAVVLTGHELGLAPMQSLRSIHMSNGRPELAAEAMRALVLAAGHQIIIEEGDVRAVARCHRRDWPADQWRTHTFTIEDAERAELTAGKNAHNYRKYPRAMLAARVTSEACRLDFADVIRGVSYVIGETDDAPVQLESDGTPAAPPCTEDAADAASEPDPAAASIRGRVARLSTAELDAFTKWRTGRNLPYPPTSPAVVKTITAELDRIESSR
jgi:hypothetical protein